MVIYLGIGSNLGNRRKNIEVAISRLKEETSIEVRKISCLYETEAVGGPPQGKFLNGAVEVESELSPQELLHKLKCIESKLGRTGIQSKHLNTILQFSNSPILPLHPNTIAPRRAQAGASGGKWGPRIIDLDILLYGDLILEEEDLKIPHPLMDKRFFVLKPLCEIAPDIFHPLRKQTVAELLDEVAE